MKKLGYINKAVCLVALATALTQCACHRAANAEAAQTPAAAPAEAVAFDADSAYAFVARQTAFGPRVPGTEAHRRCADWLVQQLRACGIDSVAEQTARLRAYDGTMLDVRNITASINPQARKRILLLSHWDSRPWADHASDPSDRRKPIDGANDGASGVGVILEIARQLQQRAPRVGVDILFTDAEDYGTHADDANGDTEDSWCLGTQYWVDYPTLDLSKIRYAILLDMVGGKDAKFPREYFSQIGAREINDKVWAAARRAGHDDRFVNTDGIPVVDDHLHLLRAGVPAIDIIETTSRGFNPTWHTLDDNIANIDPATLKAVGQTLLTLIYSE